MMENVSFAVHEMLRNVGTDVKHIGQLFHMLKMSLLNEVQKLS